VIEPAFAAARGMTIETGLTFINISSHVIMLIVGIRFVVFMTIDAGKLGIVGRILMAIGTAVPFAIMLTGIYGEILAIVGAKICRFPTGGCCVAFHTLGRKVDGRVVWIVGREVILLMTRETFG